MPRRAGDDRVDCTRRSRARRHTYPKHTGHSVDIGNGADCCGDRGALGRRGVRDRRSTGRHRVVDARTREGLSVPTLVTIANVADKAPAALGSNVTVIVQLPAGATVAPQVEVLVNDAVEAASIPVIVLLVMVSGLAPVLLSVNT